MSPNMCSGLYNHIHKILVEGASIHVELVYARLISEAQKSLAGKTQA